MLERIDHIVVLMLENRSFDCMLGRLYEPSNPLPFRAPQRGQSFDGLAGKFLSNPIPPSAPGADRGNVPAETAANTWTPVTDPGETYEHVLMQLYGAAAAADPADYAIGQALPPMNGFVADYAAVLRDQGKQVEYGCYSQVMQGFTPAQLPVLSRLAYEYAVCDRWFCSVPSQTWTNRSFLHAAASNGWVNNLPYEKWLLGNNHDTIFNRISDSGQPGLDWRVYYDAWDVLPLTLLIHFPKLAPYWRSNFAHMDQFRQDAKAGTLPAYSFIEPRYFASASDQHPPHDAARGERLIAEVYQAVREGRHWDRTLLIVTYDEHGGCFDHVPPPAAVPPFLEAGPGECGFGFDRLGVRVGAVLVSPYIERGTVFRARRTVYGCTIEVPLDHTAIPRTICLRWGLPGLTARDRASADLSGVLTLTAPRSDYPRLRPPNAGLGGVIQDAGEGLNELQYGILRAVTGYTASPLPELKNVAEALEFLKQHAAKMGLV